MMSVVHSILGDPQVSAAAVVDEDARVFERGFGDRTPQLVATAKVLSRMFHRSSPPMALADLLYAGGRLILISRSAGGLLVAMGSPSIDVERLRACAAADAPEAESHRAPSEEQASAPRIRAAETISDISAWVARVTTRARASLGGPVIRNYVKKCIAGLLSEHPVLGSLKVDLAGAVSFEDATDEDPVAMASAIAALLASFVDRASVVAPELRELDVSALRGSRSAETESPSAQENTS
jgi:hypothetical protein